MDPLNTSKVQTLIQSFEKSHQRDIRKENQTPVSYRAAQASAMVLATTALPVALPVIAIANLKSELTKEIKRGHCEKSVEIAVETMQQKIEEERFNVVQKTVKKSGGIEELEKNAGEDSKDIAQVAAASLVKGIEDKLKDPVVEQERAVRQILLILSRRSRDDPDAGKKPLSDQQIGKRRRTPYYDPYSCC